MLTLELQNDNFRPSSCGYFGSLRGTYSITESTRMSLHYLVKSHTAQKKKIPVRAYSKIASLRIRGGMPEKVTEIDIGCRGTSKNVMSYCTKNEVFHYRLLQ